MPQGYGYDRAGIARYLADQRKRQLGAAGPPQQMMAPAPQAAIRPMPAVASYAVQGRPVLGAPQQIAPVPVPRPMAPAVNSFAAVPPQAMTRPAVMQPGNPYASGGAPPWMKQLQEYQARRAALARQQAPAAQPYGGIAY